MLILNSGIFKLQIRPIKWHTYIVNCTENTGANSLYFARAFLKYKGTYLMQTDSKFAIIFLSFDMYLMGKGLRKFGEFNYIYKMFKVFSASNPFVACILTI